MFVLIGCAVAMAAIGFVSGPSAIKSQTRQIASSLLVALLAVGAKHLVLRYGNTGLDGLLILLSMLGAFVVGLVIRRTVQRRS